MTQKQTKFGEIYGYGIFVLWASVAVIVMVFFIVTNWPNVHVAIGLTLVSQIYLIAFGLPVAALASFIIGGGIWSTFKHIIPSNSLRASLAGGVTGACVISLFALDKLKTDPSEAFINIAALFLLGVWCGWAGEKLARRHYSVSSPNRADITSYILSGIDEKGAEHDL